ncbi:F0F1 ATP synthase subunit A [Desulfonema ishimotonii]|uniref:ATP synthase subunit a n=1 Tax=Desulfonema ishimotonii TaxID=45657 RepID=A0A401FWW5_9BACT|nr:F0F1 ATP synthase subunit A [Desulfonema ishimotonii]GBC61492.1 F0F1 ATP synthase subunit A [Desulfonema ishimotonii]
MRISPDNMILWQWGLFSLNGTLLFTWLVMAILGIGSWRVTRRLTADVRIPAGQHILESVVSGMTGQIRDLFPEAPEQFLPFLGTLFLFIAVSNILAVVPGFEPPTGSLSTTTALALCVFVMVPAWGISRTGLRNYLMNYLRPSPLMLPFNLVGEISRTLALAVRLFGNMMSGSMITAILLAIAPLIFPVIMQAFGLLTGLIQAYIFTVLAAVYIAAGMEVQEKGGKTNVK